MSSKKERLAEFFEIIAAPGRGKTTLLIEALEHKIKLGDRALIVLPDQSEKAWFPYYKNGVIEAEDLEEKFNPDFKGVCLIEYEEKLTFPFLLKQFKSRKLKDLNLVLDDPQYMVNKPVENELTRILSRKRQYSVDVWSNAHSYDQVPNGFFQYITVYGLGYTSAEIINRKKEVGHHEPIKRYVDKIANVERSNPNYYHFEFFTKEGEAYK